MRRVRLLTTFIAIVAMLGLVAPVAASAGTLTSATFAVSNNTTSSPNARYDYGFTTATAGTVSRIGISMPTGTSAVGTKYLALNGGANYASTPDTSANSVTGDIDVRVKVAMKDWNSSAQQTLMAKWFDTTQASWVLTTQSNVLHFYYSADGNSPSSNQVLSTASIVASSYQTVWVRATRVVNNGSSQSVITFYTSIDGVTWSMLGTPSYSGTMSNLFDSNTPVTVGAFTLGGGGPLNGKIYSAEERNGVNGPVVAGFNPNTDDSASGASWTSSSPQAEPWTVNRNGTNLPADIATDLTISNVSGLPPGGYAAYRALDNVSVYLLASATAISASAPCVLGLTGYINRPNPFSSSGTVTTYDNSGTPALIDSATTNTVTFVNPSQPTYVQSGASFYTTAMTSVTRTLTVSGGDLLTVSAFYMDPSNNMTATCSDNQGNTYASPAAYRNVGGETMMTCYTFATSSASTTTTVTFSTSTSLSGIAFTEFSGVALSAPVDAAASASGYASAGVSIYGGTATTRNDGDLIYGAIFGGPNFNSAAAAAGFTEQTYSGRIMSEYQVQSSAGSATIASTNPSNSNYVGNLIAFRPIAVQRNTVVTATIDPTFTFSVSNQSSACNGESNFVAGAGTATAISLGHLTTAANVSGGQAITVASNAGGGFAVFVRGSQATQNLRTSAYNWTDASGAYASPTALGSGEKFGYTYKDSTASSSVTNPSSATFAALDGTNRAISGSSTSPTGNACVSFDAQTGAATPAGSYSATIIYVAVPTF